MARIGPSHGSTEYALTKVYASAALSLIVIGAALAFVHVVGLFLVVGGFVSAAFAFAVYVLGRSRVKAAAASLPPPRRMV